MGTYKKYIQKQKKKTSQTSLSLEIEEKAKEMERENLRIARQAKEKLQTGYEQQKETTAELKTQGEKLESAEKGVQETAENVQKGKELTEDIKEEDNIFGFSFGLRNFFGSSKKAEKKEPHKKKQVTFKESENPVKISQEGEFSEEKETNKELGEISGLLHGMKQEAEHQKLEMKKQDISMKNISKKSERTSKEIEETNKKMDEL